MAPSTWKEVWERGRDMQQCTTGRIQTSVDGSSALTTAPTNQPSIDPFIFEFHISTYFKFYIKWYNHVLNGHNLHSLKEELWKFISINLIFIFKKPLKPKKYLVSTLIKAHVLS